MRWCRISISFSVVSICKCCGNQRTLKTDRELDVERKYWSCMKTMILTHWQIQTESFDVSLLWSLRLILLSCAESRILLYQNILFTNDAYKSANEICSLTVSDSRPSGKSMASWAAADVLDAGLSLAGFLIRLSRKSLCKNIKQWFSVI